MKLANFTREHADILAGGAAIAASSVVSTHASGTASVHVASAVTIADAGNYYSSGTVEGALQELGTATGTAYVLSSYGGKEILDSGNTGTAYTIDLSAGNVHDLTINAGTAVLALTGATNNYACSITVLLRQDATGNRLVTWPGSVEWPGGTTPTLGTAAANVDVFSLFTLDGGTVWYGFEAGGAAAAASNTVLIYDEGSLMGTATAVDFLGSGVSAAMSGGTAQVTVATGTASTSIPIYDEGSLMGTATAGLNFTGSGVSGTVTSGTAVITIAGGASFSGARAYNSGTINLNNGSYTTITLDSESYDTDSYHSTATATERMTIGTTGKYRFGANVGFTSLTAGNYAYLEIVKNSGPTVLAIGTTIGHNSTSSHICIASEAELTSGDYLWARVFVAISSVTAPRNADWSPVLWIEYCGA